jgi:hypothetical protein
MYASMTTAQVNLDHVDEIAPLYQRFLPTLQAAKGWRGITVLVDRSTGRGLLVGLRESEADAHLFETSGTFQQLLADYPPGLLMGPPQRQVVDVVFHASI